MKSQRRVESKAAHRAARPAAARRASQPGGQLRPILEQPAAIDNPADPLGGERAVRDRRRNHLADAIHTRDPNRPEPLLGLSKLLRQSIDPSPPARKHPGAHTQPTRAWPVPGRRFKPAAALGAFVDQDDLVRRARTDENGEASRLALRSESSETHATNDSGCTRRKVRGLSR